MQQAQAAVSSKSTTRKNLDDIESVRISDAFRFELASELISSLQAVIKSGNTASLSDVASIVNQMKNQKTILYLVDIKERAKGDAEMIELPKDKEFDTIAKSALLLSVLQSRPESNVNTNVLNQLEESADLGDLQGFFTSV